MSGSSVNVSAKKTAGTGGKSVERSESMDNTCPVCHDPIDVYAIGPCDHLVCYRCSTRMRVLCETMDCPICRSLMPQVAFVRNRVSFKDVSLRDFIPNRKYKIFFQDEDVEDRYLDLLEFTCRLCKNRNPDRTFGQLQTHMRKEHQLFACDLCVTHLKIFPYERKFYTRKTLAQHRRVGDADDTSYKGHPLCEFCDVRYNDKDELLKHLRKDHYFCHFCDQDGSNAYYDQYVDLLKHFGESHFLCEEGDCANPSTRFTHAFNSEIDLKAHKAAAHNKNLSKAQSREARTIEVDFQLPPRRQGNSNRGNQSEGYDDTRGGSGGRGRGQDRYNRRRERHDEDLQKAIEASLEAGEARPPVEERVPDPIHDFPSLSGAPVSAAVTQASRVTYAAPSPRVEDFPSLSSVASKGAKTAPQPTKAYSSIMSFSNDPKPAAPPTVKTSKPVSLGNVSNVPKDRWVKNAPKNTEDDYPALGSSSGASLMTNGSWVKPQPNISIVASKPAPQSAPVKRNVVRNISDENEFPTLGGGNRQKENVFSNPFGSDWVNPQNSKKKAQTSSRKDKVDKTFELPDSYFKAYEPSADSDELTNGDVGDNQEKPKSSPAPPPVQSDFPSLPGRTVKEQKGVGGGDNKKKKKNKKTEDKAQASQKSGKPADSNSSLNDIAFALVSKSNGSGSDVPKSQKKGLAKPKPTDWFDNPPVVEPTPDNNFPSLHAMTAAVQHPKPPPGFKSDPSPSPATAAAPPGFQPQPKSNGASTPPGFSSKAVLNQVPDFSLSLYAQPPDFKERNLQLIQDIKEALETVEDGFSNFRALSGQFRQGAMEASDYFVSCQSLMGDADFARIFPELLGLLPDIPKQRELYEIYQVVSKESSSKWKTSKVLLSCPVCGQIVLKQDKAPHELHHGQEGEFPTLGSITPLSDAISGPTTNSKVPPGMAANGAWIKAK